MRNQTIEPDPEKTALPLARTLHYHERTKHHPYRYARSLGRLDWAAQPDPFRRFDGAPRWPLEHPPVSDEPSFDALFKSSGLQTQPLNRVTVSRLFYDSLALSAWKRAPGTPPWSLRVNPSSGDLHPTEGYLITGPLQGLSDQAAVYHYSPFDHALEQRMVFSPEEWGTLSAALPTGCVLVALTSIYWRESWKYGERAFRYCHHDIGHAIGAIVFAGETLGRRTRLIDTVADADLAVLLGIHGQHGMEAEHPDCLLAIFPAKPIASSNSPIELRLPTALLKRLATADFAGTENRLSPNHHPWAIIDEVSAATRYDGQQVTTATHTDEPSPVLPMPKRTVSARRIIRQRRSAVAMDGQTPIPRETFFYMMSRITPQLFPAVFEVLPWDPRVSLALFVHRVEGLVPGLYALIRHPSHRQSLQEVTHPEFAWQQPEGCPKALELYLLDRADARPAAKTISCHQDIAADGAFSLGMLAQFEGSLRQNGPWFYPRLFWETGLIGHILYLEAEAAGIRATGIGCFFDDLMHEVLGFTDHSWQSLYHFTVGAPVDDPRLQTLDAYAHRVPTQQAPVPTRP